MIMSLFAGVGFNTYTKQIQEKQLDTTVEAYVTAIRLARERAISRDLSVDQSCTQFNRYFVRSYTSTNPDSYQSRFDCLQPALKTTYATVNLKNNISFTNVPGDTTVSFYPPLGCTSAGCDAGDYSVTFKNSAINKCKRVVINQLGNTSVSDTPCT